MPISIRCLLLVDDEQKEVDTTKLKLSKTFLKIEEILVANSLAQAITAIGSKDVDVVLLDLDLEDSKSIDTLKAIRTVTMAVIVVLSSAQDELLGVEALRAGADDFLSKSEMTVESLRKSIIHSTTRHNMRVTACRIEQKLDELEKMSAPAPAPATTLPVGGVV